MSGISPPTMGEIAAAAPTFSYAQAAKGKTVSANTSPNPENVPSDSKDSPPSAGKTGVKPSEIAGETQSSTEPRESSDGQLSSKRAEPIAKTEAGSVEVTPVKSVAKSARQSTGIQETNGVSHASSPSYGTASTSTLLKEDDPFEIANGNGNGNVNGNSSSDSTWEKLSQDSQSGEKNPEREDVRKETNNVPAWEQIKVSGPSFKEAPAPAVNVWQQRMLAIRTQASKETKPAQAIDNHIPQSVGKSPDGPQYGKPDRERRNRPLTEHPHSRSGPPSFRDSTKNGDGKDRRLDEESRFHKSPDSVKPRQEATAPPPPTGDAVSWPTPESAQGEAKKGQERGIQSEGDKEKPSASKAHGKEKWVPVPFVPTAVFQTPLPSTSRGGRAGGRAGRGGRDGSLRGGHVSHGSINGEKSGPPPAGGAPPLSTSVTDRTKGDMGPPPRPGSSVPKPKRATSAGPPTLRDQRKLDGPNAPEKPNEPVNVGQRPYQENRSIPMHNRRSSVATQTENTPPTLRRNSSQSATKDDPQASRRSSQSVHSRQEHHQSFSHDSHSHPRSAGPERNVLGRQTDNNREMNGFPHHRERGEGRPDRGRGSYRGNRGNHNFNGAYQTNGQNFPNGPPNNQSTVSYQQPKSASIIERQSQAQTSPFPPPQQSPRNNRSGVRSQSIPNTTAYGQFLGGSSRGGQQLPNLQTDFPNMYGYQPGHPAVMSAMPYQPYVDQMQLLGMVQMQMEYYFSVDNLCKDMFLRKNMDSQGFVFLSVLVNFPRIKQLTPDIDLIKYVCMSSRVIEFQTGGDGLDRLRPHGEWQQWILTMEDRDPSARNDGPTSLRQPRFASTPSALSHTGDYMPLTQNPVSPRSSFLQGQAISEGTTSKAMNGIIQSIVSTPPASTQHEYTMEGQIIQTPLTTDVPDLALGLLPLNDRVTSAPDLQLQNENSFSDEQVESLMIVIRKPITPSAPARAPFHTAESRTFSNGSIDGRTIADEMTGFEEHQSQPSINGDNSAEGHDRESPRKAMSPFNTGAPMRPASSNAPPVFWVKDKDTPMGNLPHDLTHESYNVFRLDALHRRGGMPKGQCHKDMEILYQFWSHFLIRNFNTRMYEEFRQLAFEDATERDSKVGTKNLVQYYDKSILNDKIISDDLARDYVDLVNMEGNGKERLAFDKLRAAWRNGAFNLKNRKKIDNIINAGLKTELER